MLLSKIFEYLQTKNIKFKRYDSKEYILELPIIAGPGSKKEGIEVMGDGSLKVKVRKRPVEGQANEAIISSLSKILGLSTHHIELLKGIKSRQKVILLRYLFTKQKDENYYCDKWKGAFND